MHPIDNLMVVFKVLLLLKTDETNPKRAVDGCLKKQ